MSNRDTGTPADPPPSLQGIPIVDGEPLQPADERLIATFDQMEHEQVQFLDDAAKRIVELVTALLGVLFVLTAFGSDFPPPYLTNNTPMKLLAMAVLMLYMAALVLAMVVITPRKYRRHIANLSLARKDLDNIIAFKLRWSRVAGIAFMLASVLLAVLIVLIVWSA